MGTCQSSFCQCVAEDALIQGTDLTAKQHLAVSSQVGKLKPKNDLFSPTYTEATTPGSTLITPQSEPLRLTSVISTGNVTFEDHVTKQRASEPLKFHFNTPSLEHDEFDIEPGKGATASTIAEAIILNPPLLAPPAGQAEVLLQARKSSTVSDRMIREFKKLRNQATLESQKDRITKREAKIDNRREDIKEHNDRWDEFQEIRKLCNSELEQPTAQTLSSLCVNIRKDLKRQGFRGEDDCKSCQSELSLLPADSMDAQRAYFAEKRNARLAKYNARKMQQELKAKLSSRTEKREISYFHAFVEDSKPCSTPQVSPPRLLVNTDGTKVTLGGTAEDYGNRHGTKESMTPLEVIIKPDERKDDTSAITDADFDKDFWLHRRRMQPMRVKDDDSHGSSLVSYGCELPASVKSISTVDENKRGQRKVTESKMRQSTKQSRPGMRTRTLSTGVAAMARPGDQVVDSRTLRDRIACLEKRMGIVSVNSTAKLRGTTPGRVDSSALCVLQSPTVSQSCAFPTNDIEPTKLEAMFDESSDIREKIVLKNSVRSTNSVVQWMNKDAFRRICADDHAMVKVSRGVEDGCYLIQESNDNDSVCDLQFHNDLNLIPTPRDTSLAADVAEEVGAVLSKYRFEATMDARIMDPSFDDVDGKLFCA